MLIRVFALDGHLPRSACNANFKLRVDINNNWTQSMENTHVILAILSLIIIVSLAASSCISKAKKRKRLELEKQVQQRLVTVSNLENHLANCISLGMAKTLQFAIMSRIANQLCEANTFIFCKKREANIKSIRDEIRRAEESGQITSEAAKVKCKPSEYPAAIRLIKTFRTIAQKEYVYGSFGQNHYIDIMRYLTEYEAKIYITHYGAKIKSELSGNQDAKARSTMKRCLSVLKNFNCQHAEMYSEKLNEMIEKIDSKIKLETEKKIQSETEREEELRIVFEGTRKKW